MFTGGYCIRTAVIVDPTVSILERYPNVRFIQREFSDFAEIANHPVITNYPNRRSVEGHSGRAFIESHKKFTGRYIDGFMTRGGSTPGVVKITNLPDMLN